MEAYVVGGWEVKYVLWGTARPGPGQQNKWRLLSILCRAYSTVHL